MRTVNGAGMALFALLVGAVLILTASFLPFFITEVWGPLWGNEWQAVGVVRTFGRIGPVAGVSRWPVYVAAPLAALVVLIAFIIALGMLVIHLRSNATRSG